MKFGIFLFMQNKSANSTFQNVHRACFGASQIIESMVSAQQFTRVVCFMRVVKRFLRHTIGNLDATSKQNF